MQPELPAAVARYIKNHKLMKQAEKERDADRPEVIEKLKDGEFDGIKNEPRRDIKFDDEGMIAFLEKIVGPENIDKFFKRTIKLDAIDELVKEGKLDFAEVPDSLYTVKTIDVIKVSLK